MQIKGQAKIELFHALTGMQTDCIEETNLVTDYVKNIINPPQMAREFAYYESSTQSLNAYQQVYRKKIDVDLMYSSDLITNYFSGLLLFREKLEESKDHIAMTVGDVVCAAACETTSMANLELGTLNANETADVTDSNGKVIGKRFVWDFGTDRANGQIAAMSLVSPACEHRLYGPSGGGDGSFLTMYGYYYGAPAYRNGYLVNAGVDSITTIGSPLKQKEDQSVLSLVYETETRKLKIYQNTYDYSKVSLGKSNHDTAGRTYTLLKEVQLTSSAITTNLYVTQTVGDTLYVMTTASVYLSNGNYAKLNLHMVNLSTFELTEQLGITLPVPWYSWGDFLILEQDVFYTAGKYGSYNKVVLVHTTLQNLADHTVIMEEDTLGNCKLNYYKGLVYLACYSSYTASSRFGILYPDSLKIVHWGSNFSLSSSYNSSSVFRMVPSDYLKPPFVLYQIGSETNCYMGTFALCLSTINNLASPVIKTADKTMKITYTIKEISE
ncbi:hypothetical protein [Anaeromicropila populeti]|uniref:Uncharacterized protein n=1 Tax=Anaeromicropila populeti TaxID=37658 RepID=A0A1I6LRK6_9FIRM|nr:hypothetical protein [Anaeromicropila populeti]SFS06091.1 hypothetical protein SAMN05661086_03511 [Anaeromicropila populeti]